MDWERLNLILYKTEMSFFRDKLEYSNFQSTVFYNIDILNKSRLSTVKWLSIEYWETIEKL